MRHRGDLPPASSRRPTDPGPSGAGDDRACIQVEKGAGAQLVLDTIRALEADPGLYQRDHQLVHVVGAEPPAGRDRAKVAAGTPVIRPVVQPVLWARSSKWIRWEKWDGRAGRMVAADAPPNVLAAVLAWGDYHGIRHLNGIIESPSIRPDGTLILEPGHDAATGFLYAPTIEFRRPLEEPTQQHARNALEVLRGLFVDFPHESENAKMVPVAAIMTIVARPMIQGCCPAFLFDASTRGSGKTLQNDAVVLAATGRLPPPMAYPEDPAELEKIIGAYAIKGPQAIKWDNINLPFGGGPIDRVLTAADTVELRILGESRILEVPWRTVVTGNGNNLGLMGDTARRVLPCRVVPDRENPEERPATDFRYPDLRGWIREHRSLIVCAALTILRAWHLAGRPRGGCKTWGGGFESWSEIVPAAIVFAGGADPMECRPTVSGEEEPEKAALGAVLVGLARLDESRSGMTTRSIIGALYSHDRLRGEAPPDGWDDLREAIEALVPPRPGQAPDAKKLGEKLRYLAKDRVIGGKRLRGDMGHGGVRRWRVEG